MMGCMSRLPLAGALLAVTFAGCSREPPPPAVVPPAVAKVPPPAATLPASTPVDAAPAAAEPVAPADAVEPAAAEDPPTEADECASIPPRVPTIPPPDRVAFQDPKTELWGYRTSDGKVVIPARYSEVTAFDGRGAAAVTIVSSKGHPFRFIDPAGKELGTAFLFDNGPDYWSDGFVRIVDAQGRFGFVDHDGKVAIKPQYAFAYPFCRGVARVAIGDKPAYIDVAGKPTAGPANDDRPTIPEKHVD